MKFTSIRTKISLLGGICLLITAAIIVTYSAIAMKRNARVTRQKAIEMATKYARVQAKHTASSIKGELEAALDTARALTHMLAAIKDDEFNIEVSRDEVGGILKNVLEENSQFAGIYTGWEPDAFDNMDIAFAHTEGHDTTGRFIPHWSRAGSDQLLLEPLFDYEKEGTGDYYLVPKHTKQESIIDPYVYPVQGEPLLMTSLVIPITVQNQFYGIVGINLRVDLFQNLVDDAKDFYGGAARIILISHNGTLTAVTGSPELIGKHIKHIHEDFEEDLDNIRSGRESVEIMENQLELFTPLKIGRTTTPWSVNIIVPMETITADADEQLRQANDAMLKMIGIGVLCAGVALGLLWFAARSITKPIIHTAGFAEKLSKGDLSVVINIDQKDEIGILANALSVMKDRIRDVLNEMDGLIRAVQEGKLDVRGKAEAFAGGWRDLVIGVNNVIDAFVVPINVTAEYLDRIGKGDIPDKITEETKGDFNEIKNNLNLLIDNISNVLQETNALIQAVQEGKLDTRGNAGTFAGDWRELVVGINNVIDAFVAPFNVTAEYLERIAKGDVPGKITEEYKGKFNEIKDNLNQCIDAVNGLVAETVRLTESAVAGQLNIRGDTDKFSGDYARIVQGVNDTLDAVIGPLNVAAEYVDRISKGDIPDQITEEYKGDFNEIKQNLNTLIEAMHDITRLAEEMAGGNLLVEVDERSAQDTLMQALNAMIQQLKEVVVNVKAATDTVAVSGEELSTRSEAMSQGAAEQASAAEEASSSMEQMAATIRQNADNAQQTGKIALESAEYAEESSRVVAETVVAMQQIAQKIAIIEEIADQTRMLSLNATIEAARAQEHGKAFSVVASEVRNLSDIAKKAAEEINELATSSLAVSEKAGKMLTTLLPSIRKTTELVQEISAASNEQSMGAAQVNMSIQQLDHVTQQNAMVSDQIASTAGELAHQAEQLQSAISFFRTKDTAQKIPDVGEHAQKIGRTMPADIGTRVTMTGKKPRKDDKRDVANGNDGSPTGYGSEMFADRDNRDGLDADFGQY